MSLSMKLKNGKILISLGPEVDFHFEWRFVLLLFVRPGKM